MNWITAPEGHRARAEVGVVRVAKPDITVATSRGSLGEALKDSLYWVERSGSNVEVAALARKANVSWRSVYAYFAGETLPPRGLLNSLLTALEVSVAERGWFQDPAGVRATAMRRR